MEVAPSTLTHIHTHTTQSRLSKDNQLRCKCSPEGGGIERSPVSLAWEHKVCLWWGQLVTAERSQSVHLSQPTLNILTERLIHAFILVAKWFTALTHTYRHTRATQTHLDPRQRLRGLSTITFSSLLEGRKNTGATRRLLCPCGKTHGRLSQCCLDWDWTRAQLLNRKSPPAHRCTASSPPHCLAASWLREESQNWHRYNKVSGPEKELPVCSECVWIWETHKNGGWRADGNRDGKGRVEIERECNVVKID